MGCSKLEIAESSSVTIGSRGPDLSFSGISEAECGSYCCYKIGKKPMTAGDSTGAEAVTAKNRFKQANVSLPYKQTVGLFPYGTKPEFLMIYVELSTKPVGTDEEVADKLKCFEISLKEGGFKYQFGEESDNWYDLDRPFHIYYSAGMMKALGENLYQIHIKSTIKNELKLTIACGYSQEDEEPEDCTP
ncbi:MAG: hypothetical protein AAGF83_12090 [Cyanobacteria bacterium P01_G01_bin.67]